MSLYDELLRPTPCLLLISFIFKITGITRIEGISLSWLLQRKYRPTRTQLYGFLLEGQWQFHDWVTSSQSKFPIVILNYFSKKNHLVIVVRLSDSVSTMQNLGFNSHLRIFFFLIGYITLSGQSFNINTEDGWSIWKAYDKPLTELKFHWIQPWFQIP